MRLSLLLYFFLFSFSAKSQIFFSEYAEGSSNNKYLEIYNPTSEIIDLSDYAYPSAANDIDIIGEYEYWNNFEVGAYIEPGGVYIIAHPSADSSILEYANETHTYLSNGNDGYALVWGTEENYEVLDRIGDWQGNPGDGWDVAGVVNATKDHTLLRKSSVSIGNGDWASSAGSNTDDSEWIVLDNEVWDNLGFHQCDSCGVAVIYGCTDSNAINYNADATIDDGSCEYIIIEGCTDSTACNYDASATNGFFIYSNTDANMTIALEYTVGLTAGLESGDIIGVFYTDDFGNLVCGGTAQWNNESLAIAAWGTESGLDNGFDVGEEFEFIIQKFNGQMYSTNNTMNTSPPFSSLYTANGFGQITELILTEILLDEENCFYPELYYDCDGNCINDSDGDGICDEFELSIDEKIISSKLLRSIDITGRVINDVEKFNKIIINISEDGRVNKSIKIQ
jgi:hypothetical protein